MIMSSDPPVVVQCERLGKRRSRTDARTTIDRDIVKGEGTEIQSAAPVPVSCRADTEKGSNRTLHPAPIVFLTSNLFDEATHLRADASLWEGVSCLDDLRLSTNLIVPGDRDSSTSDEPLLDLHDTCILAVSLSGLHPIFAGLRDESRDIVLPAAVRPLVGRAVHAWFRRPTHPSAPRSCRSSHGLDRSPGAQAPAHEPKYREIRRDAFPSPPSEL
jgi:hypothetical protein